MTYRRSNATSQCHSSDRVRELRDVPDTSELHPGVIVNEHEPAGTRYASRAAFNTPAPILKLPNELFIRVACILRSSWKPESGKDLGWLKVTFICQSWGSAALQAASLWTHVDLAMGSKWADVFLKRARSMPVTLTAEHANMEFLESNIKAIQTVLYRESANRFLTLLFSSYSCR